MSAAEAEEYEAILKIVRVWPPARRIILIQAVLQTLAQSEATPGRLPTLDRALGLLATDRPAPSDADIATWLEERSSRAIDGEPDGRVRRARSPQGTGPHDRHSG